MVFSQGPGLQSNLESASSLQKLHPIQKHTQIHPIIHIVLWINNFEPGPGALLFQKYTCINKNIKSQLRFFSLMSSMGWHPLGLFCSWKKGPIPRSFWTEGPITGEGGGWMKVCHVCGMWGNVCLNVIQNAIEGFFHIKINHYFGV